MSFPARPQAYCTRTCTRISHPALALAEDPELRPWDMSGARAGGWVPRHHIPKGRSLYRHRASQVQCQQEGRPQA